MSIDYHAIIVTFVTFISTQNVYNVIYRQGGRCPLGRKHRRNAILIKHPPGGDIHREKGLNMNWEKADGLSESVDWGSIRINPNDNRPTFHLEEDEMDEVLAMARDERVSKTIIVTRHAGMVAWLAGKGITGTVIQHATSDDVACKDVFGMLPLHLAAQANSITTVDMPGLRADQRGVDLSPQEMDAAGATLSKFVVRKD